MSRKTDSTSPHHGSVPSPANAQYQDLAAGKNEAEAKSSNSSSTQSEEGTLHAQFRFRVVGVREDLHNSLRFYVDVVDEVAQIAFPGVVAEIDLDHPADELSAITVLPPLQERQYAWGEWHSYEVSFCFLDERHRRDFDETIQAHLFINFSSTFEERVARYEAEHREEFW